MPLTTVANFTLFTYFPKGICPKMNVIERLQFELATISQSNTLATTPHVLPLYTFKFNVFSYKKYFSFFNKEWNILFFFLDVTQIYLLWISRTSDSSYKNLRVSCPSIVSVYFLVDLQYWLVTENCALNEPIFILRHFRHYWNRLLWYSDNLQKFLCKTKRRECQYLKYFSPN